MSRRDIMVDIETLGNKLDSTIIQLAAISFDIETGEMFSIFNEVVDIEKCKELCVTGDTLKWWLNTNPELFSQLILEGNVSSSDLMLKFDSFVRKEINRVGVKNVYLWGNGILFDNKMIQYQYELYKSLGISYPIHYKNDRDLRTLLELASYKLSISEEEIRDRCRDDSLVKHYALDDVRFQVRVAHFCYNALMDSTI